MKKISTLLLAALLVLSSLGLAGCGSVSSDSTFSLQWPNVEVFGSGEKVTADLTGIPSTGYMWTVEIENESVLEETAHTTEKVAENASEEMVGGAEIEHYEFAAYGDGETLVTAKYARSWEETPDDLVHVFKVTVTNGKISAMHMMGDISSESILDTFMDSMPEAN